MPLPLARTRSRNASEISALADAVAKTNGIGGSRARMVSMMMSMSCYRKTGQNREPKLYDVSVGLEGIEDSPEIQCRILSVLIQ